MNVSKRQREHLLELLRKFYDIGESNGFADSRGQADDSDNDFAEAVTIYEAEIDSILDTE